MKHPRTATALFALAMIVPALAAAQSWRSFDAARQLTDSAPLSVNVVYSAGRVLVRPNRSNDQFDAHLRYDADRFAPVYTYEAATKRLELGVRSLSRNTRWTSEDGSELTLSLAAATPVALSLDVGAAETDLDLSGLRVQSLTLSTGASDTHVRFDTPNPIRASSVRIDAGAANIEVMHLANARADNIAVNVGVGRVLLDLTGEWTNNVAVDLTAALGAIELVIPADIGVRITTSSVLQSVDFTGLTKRDGFWISDNYDSAPFRATITGSGALGRFSLRRSSR
jgi:hypothetical protein